MFSVLGHKEASQSVGGAEVTNGVSGREENIFGQDN
jgi:hypothetical protein